MGSKRSHELRNKLQLAMLSLPKDYTSGDLIRCFADETVKFMESLSPEATPRTTEMLGKEYVSFYNYGGPVYGIPAQVVKDHYHLHNRMSPFYKENPSDTDLINQLDWMSEDEIKPHLIILKEAETLSMVLKDLENINEVEVIELTEDVYTN